MNRRGFLGGVLATVAAAVAAKLPFKFPAPAVVDSAAMNYSTATGAAEMFNVLDAWNPYADYVNLSDIVVAGEESELGWLSSQLAFRASLTVDAIMQNHADAGTSTYRFKTTEQDRIERSIRRQNEKRQRRGEPEIILRDRQEADSGGAHHREISDVLQGVPAQIEEDPAGHDREQALPVLFQAQHARGESAISPV